MFDDRRRAYVRAAAGVVDVALAGGTLRWVRSTKLSEGDERYGSKLVGRVEGADVPAAYADNAPVLNGYEIINQCLDQALRDAPRVIIFGEDVGTLGDVNYGIHPQKE